MSIEITPAAFLPFSSNISLPLILSSNTANTPYSKSLPVAVLYSLSAFLSTEIFAFLVLYAILTKKEWKLPTIEVIMRAFYGIALISGIVIRAVHGIIAVSIIHKVSAALFIALLIVLFVYKLATNKKA